MSVTQEPRTRAARALPLRAELRRQLRRRRTRLSFGFLMLLPLILVLAFALGSDDDPGEAPSFVDLAQQGPANLTVFALFASTGFLLVVLPLWCLAVGAVAYGTDPFEGPTGERLGWGEFAVRLAVIVGYLAVSLLFVSSMAFFIGVLTDAPLGAVGGAVLLVIVSNILDSITALGDLREALPTHAQYAWADALAQDVDWSEMVTGGLWSVAYSIVLLWAAFTLFARKDVLS